MNIELPTKTMMANIYMGLHNLSYEEAEKKVDDDDKFFQKIMNLRPTTAEILYNKRFNNKGK